jgi:hypothetical protein
MKKIENSVKITPLFSMRDGNMTIYKPFVGILMRRAKSKKERWLEELKEDKVLKKIKEFSEKINALSKKERESFNSFAKREAIKINIIELVDETEDDFLNPKPPWFKLKRYLNYLFFEPTVAFGHRGKNESELVKKSEKISLYVRVKEPENFFSVGITNEILTSQLQTEKKKSNSSSIEWSFPEELISKKTRERYYNKMNINFSEIKIFRELIFPLMKINYLIDLCKKEGKKFKIFMIGEDSSLERTIVEIGKEELKEASG